MDVHFLSRLISVPFQMRFYGGTKHNCYSLSGNTCSSDMEIGELWHWVPEKTAQLYDKAKDNQTSSKLIETKLLSNLFKCAAAAAVTPSTTFPAHGMKHGTSQTVVTNT